MFFMVCFMLTLAGIEHHEHKDFIALYLPDKLLIAQEKSPEF